MAWMEPLPGGDLAIAQPVCIYGDELAWFVWLA